MNGSGGTNNVGARVGDGEEDTFVGIGDGGDLVWVIVGVAGKCVGSSIEWVGVGEPCLEHPTSRTNINNQIVFLIIRLISPSIICKDTDN
jgi:hypothetical protein